MSVPVASHLVHLFQNSLRAGSLHTRSLLHLSCSTHVGYQVSKPILSLLNHILLCDPNKVLHGYIIATTVAPLLVPSIRRSQYEL
jgi:hypothetical protein